MALIPAAEEALEWAIDAAEAAEEAAKKYGRHSEEARLAQAAYKQWKEEYQELTGASDHAWASYCESFPEARGCRDYDV